MVIAKQATRIWYALDVEAEVAAREAVEYALMEAGALGTESAETNETLWRVTAYFDDPPNREHVRSDLLDALTIYSLPSSSVRDMTIREVADQDWLAEWKKGWQPIPVGERFLVAPPWSAVPATEERIVIRIEPGMAFGTGTHETTRLCLEAIEKYFHGRSFLDVGTGTGILAIAAAKLCPEAHIEACDTDVEATAIARENARLNNVSNNITFRNGGIDRGPHAGSCGVADETTASVDCVCANLTTETILELLPSLIAITCGRLICCGILAAQVEVVVGALGELGVSNPTEITTAGEWACIVV